MVDHIKGVLIRPIHPHGGGSANALRVRFVLNRRQPVMFPCREFPLRDSIFKISVFDEILTAEQGRYSCCGKKCQQFRFEHVFHFLYHPFLVILQIRSAAEILPETEIHKAGGVRIVLYHPKEEIQQAARRFSFADGAKLLYGAAIPGISAFR